MRETFFGRMPPKMGLMIVLPLLAGEINLFIWGLLGFKATQHLDYVLVGGFWAEWKKKTSEKYERKCLGGLFG